MKDIIKNILQEYINEQRVPRGYWNAETLKKEAEKYKTEGEFISQSQSAYQTARRLGILDYVLQNLERTDRKKYSKDYIINLAQQFTKKNDFKKKYRNLYNIARDHGWWAEASSHMVDAYNSWNKEDVEKEALKYTYPSEFQYNSPKAYGAAVYNGWLEDVTSHMGRLGSRKKRMVYAYEFPDNFVYVGLTYHKDKRDDQHMVRGPVFNHIKQTSLTPIRIEISDYIDAQDASKLEIETEKLYRNDGWNILNQAKPGVLGGSTPIWTPETVRIESAKYKTLKEFRSGNPKAYNAAKRNGWIPDLGLANTDVRWDFESVAKEASKYKTRKEFERGNNGAYQYAARNKILDDITTHMDIKKIKWTKEMVSQEAQNYRTKKEFEKGSKKAYQAAYNNGWLEDVTTHMVSGIKTHTKDDINTIAKNYSKYNDFLRDYPHLAQYATKKKWNDIFDHMVKKKVWSVDELRKEASKYNTLGEFIIGNKNAYQAAYRKKILDDITSHMTKTRKVWTPDLVRDEATKYKTRHEFEKGNGTAYQLSKKYKILDDLFPNPKSKGSNQYIRK